jgi:(1->4)-alpha-D-glucan 1-alpha-D-glucosylmutase
MNRSKKTLVQERPAPSTNDEYLLYQTVLGTFPAPEVEPPELAAYCERIEAYMLKAVREAKVCTSWINPNEEYENALTQFVRALLASSSRNIFVKDLATQSRTLAWFGMLNSFSMTLLKMTSPGVPDIYQGSEAPDFSLVDPDNRRAVDYAARERMLERLTALATSPRLAEQVKQLAARGFDAGAKTWLIWRTLELRRQEPQLFRDSNYVPLQAHGTRSEHVIAFLRRAGTRSVIAIAGRLFMKLGVEAGKLPLGSAPWGDTAIDAGPLTGALTNVLTGESVSVHNGQIRLADAMRSFPCALLIG